MVHSCGTAEIPPAGRAGQLRGVLPRHGQHHYALCAGESLQQRLPPLFLPPTKQQHGTADDYIVLAHIRMRHLSPSQVVGFHMMAFTLLAAFYYRFLLYCAGQIAGRACNRSVVPARAASQRIDPVILLSCGGADAPSNMPWLSIADIRARIASGGKTVVNNQTI